MFNMYITLKLQGMVFLGILHLAGMTRSDITEKCSVQLYWVTEYGVGG